MARIPVPVRVGATAAALALSASLAFGQAPGTAHATTRTTTEAGVTIKVTPVALLPVGWMFAIVLDTQAAPLDDNLVAQSVLVADTEQIKATEWDGAPPGGQRRDGILTFPVPKGDAAVVELRIGRKGEAAPRVFRWDRADLK
jgi:hypothetical protein